MTGVQLSVFLFSSRRRHTRSDPDWSSDVCSSDLAALAGGGAQVLAAYAVADGERDLAFVGRVVRALAVEGEHQQGRGGKRVDEAVQKRSEERRVGEEGRSRWSPYH